MKKSGKSKILGVLALAAIFACAPACAQTSAPAGQTAAAAPIEDSRAILPQLKGLRFIDKPEKLIKTGFETNDVAIDGPHLLFWPGVYQDLQSFIGKPFSRATMTKITAVVSKWYQTQHRPFVDVSFPEQDISNGVVQVVVTESRLGHVRVQGNNWFSNGLLASQISLQPGDRLDSNVLEADLSRLNLSPYRQIKAVAEKSDIEGATDLVLQTDDRIPLHVFTSYANNGVPSLGRSNFSIGIEWANAFWLDEDLSYQFTTSDDFWQNPLALQVKPGRATLEENQLTYTIPLPWHDRMVIFGNYMQESPRINQFFTQVGVNWQISYRYVVSLPTTDTFTQEFQFGYDYKDSNNNLAFGGLSASRNSNEIDQFPFIYNATLDDSYGRTIFLDEIVMSPGRMMAGNSDQAFQPNAGGTQTGVPYAHAGYVYADANVTRVTQLPYNTTWILRINSQGSTSNLLASEQLGDGGVESVRGYDERTASGPVGALVSSEFRSPPVSVIDSLFDTKTNDKFQADIFWDWGYVTQVKYVEGSDNATTLQSAGGGIHYVVDRFVDLRFEYGWQLRKAPGATNRGGEAYLSAVVGY